MSFQLAFALIFQAYIVRHRLLNWYIPMDSMLAKREQVATIYGHVQHLIYMAYSSSFVRIVIILRKIVIENRIKNERQMSYHKQISYVIIRRFVNQNKRKRKGRQIVLYERRYNRHNSREFSVRASKLGQNHTVCIHKLKSWVKFTISVIESLKYTVINAFRLCLGYFMGGPCQVCTYKLCWSIRFML